MPIQRIDLGGALDVQTPLSTIATMSRQRGLQDQEMQQNALQLQRLAQQIQDSKKKADEEVAVKKIIAEGGDPQAVYQKLLPVNPDAARAYLTNSQADVLQQQQHADLRFKTLEGSEAPGANVPAPQPTQAPIQTSLTDPTQMSTPEAPAPETTRAELPLPTVTQKFIGQPDVVRQPQSRFQLGQAAKQKFADQKAIETASKIEIQRDASQSKREDAAITREANTWRITPPGGQTIEGPKEFVLAEIARQEAAARQEDQQKFTAGENQKNRSNQATIANNRIAQKNKELEGGNQSAPGQLVYAATGKPVPDAKVGNVAAAKIADYDSVIQQSDLVKGMLDTLGDTGAIKGYVLRQGVYWPVVQDKITAEQSEAVAEIQRLVNSYLYAVSGKQINEREMERIQKTAPDLRFTKEANQKIAQHFRQYVASAKDNYLKLRGWKVKDGAAAAAPSGVDPAVWNVMTPEERALWKN